jgi:hypothetical protein
MTDIHLNLPVGPECRDNGDIVGALHDRPNVQE